MAKPFHAQHLQASQNTFSYHQTESCSKQDSFSQTRSQERVMASIPKRIITIGMSNNILYSLKQRSHNQISQIMLFKNWKNTNSEKRTSSKRQLPSQPLSNTFGRTRWFNSYITLYTESKIILFLEPYEKSKRTLFVDKGCEK